MKKFGDDKMKMEQISASGEDNNDQWYSKVLSFERNILDGQQVPLEELRTIPDAIRMKSPVLLRAECEEGLLHGKMLETKRLLEAGLRGYAAQADEMAMLTMMGMLALLYEQVGDRRESSPLIALLRQEWSRSPERCSGFVPWALARAKANETLGADNEAQEIEEYFFAAADCFRQEGKPGWAAFVLLDRLLYDPSPVEGPEWKLWLNWLKRHAADKTYGETISRLLERNEAGPELCDALPGRYGYLARAVLFQEHAGQPEAYLSDDIEVQIYAGAAAAQAALKQGKKEAAEVELRSLQKLSRLVSTPAVIRTVAAVAEAAHKRQGSGASGAAQAEAYANPSLPQARKDSPLPSAEASETAASPGRPQKTGQRAAAKPPAEMRKWRISLLDAISFTSPQVGEMQPQWKRRKAAELFVYLLLQPGYRANREQVMEKVFGEGDPAKRSNQLYVTLHDLRHTLREMVIAEDAVYARRGVIGVEEQWVEMVDAEKYLTLSRVGDQLWMDDREAACRLYDEALPLYGLLAAELPGAEWLERMREQLLDRQTLMYKRLVAYYQEIDDQIRAEQRLAEWIAFRPEQEEAYEIMIVHCLGHGRRTEATGWYKRLERVCKEELGIEPHEELKRLLWSE